MCDTESLAIPSLAFLNHAMVITMERAVDVEVQSPNSTLTELLRDTPNFIFSLHAAEAGANKGGTLDSFGSA